MADDGGGFDLPPSPPQYPGEAAWVNRPAFGWPLGGAPLTEEALRGMYVAPRGYPPDVRFVFHLSSNQPDFVQAEARAEAALRRHMTPRQRVGWKRYRWCWVDSQQGRRYKLFKHCTYNITEYQKGGLTWKPIADWCLGIRTGVPPSDIWLTQLLYLKCNEHAFRNIANRQSAGND